MSATPISGDIESPEDLIERDPKTVLRTSLIRGIAILVPLAVTLAVFGFVLDFVSGMLNPVVDLVRGIPGIQTLAGGYLVKVITVGVLLVVVLVVGFVAEYRSGPGRLGESFDEFMASIPGLGSVYTSFNEMSELLLDSDTDSFQEVRLVEYPTQGSYAMAFKTAETPDVVTDATGKDMETLFMPMAPNPVMGGFVVHVPQERVVDVDLTVEEGIRAIVTSGVAVGDGEVGAPPRAAVRKLGRPADAGVADRPAATRDDSTGRGDR